MKKLKVINVEYRKDSDSFPEFMKYDITLLNEDGTEVTIPAYGKDLQDALARVVRERKIKDVQRKVEKMPDIVWSLLWFVYILAWLGISNLIFTFGKYNGLVFLFGLILLTCMTLALSGKLNFKKWKK
mgnify:FL=1